MRILKFTLSVFIIFCCITVHAQTWLKDYLYSPNNYSYNPTTSVFNDTHGGLIATQYYNGVDSVYQNILLRINYKGDSIWSKVVPDTETVYSIANLTNGDYIVGKYVGSFAVFGTQTYIIDHLDTNGNLLNERVINSSFFNASPGVYNNGATQCPMIVADHHNHYYVLYYMDTTYTTQHWDPINQVYFTVDSSYNRTYIDKYNSANALIWRKIDVIPADITSAGVHFDNSRIQAGSAILNEKEGLLYGRFVDKPDDDDSLHYYLEKRDSTGVVLWSKNAKTYFSHADTGLYYWPYINATNDSNYLLLFQVLNDSAHNFAPIKQTLAKLYSNGNLIKSVTVDSAFGVTGVLASSMTMGIQTSAGNYMFPATMIYDTLGDQTSGINIYDKNLNLLSFTPEPIPYYNGAALVANKQGGAFCAYAPIINYYANFTTVCNFDSSFNANPVNLSGKIIQDNNNNCLTDNGDYKIQNSIVTVTDQYNTSWYGITDTGGNYKVNLPDNTYNLTHSLTGYKQNECPSSGTLNYTFSGYNTTTNANFYDKLTPNIKDIAVSMYSDCFVPGYGSNIYVMVSNVGTTTASVTLTVDLDPSVTYVSSSPSPVLVSGNTLTYNISNLDVDSIENILISTSTSTSVSLGTALNFSATAPLLNDYAPANNADTLLTQVVGSFDPNGKTVNRPYKMIPGKEMIYTVNFQNTGTYPARNIVVVDTLSPLLDMSTFRMISGSPKLPVVTSKDGRRLIFKFNNINLPDKKSNEPASHGKFVYAISAKKTLSLGDTINNTAFIFFDFNSAVVTNTATNVISKKNGLAVPAMVREQDVQVYPNPTSGNINIIVPATANDWIVSVVDIAGREIYSQAEVGGRTLLSCYVKAVPGIYFVKIANAATGEVTVKKLLIKN
ncbi:MAG: T9SS type A sorting domain-containing protein [Flavipsychrobacter sp.]|nr:T9SS type A sorting domain-containing protein [Flavipsychrobacter sp.]